MGSDNKVRMPQSMGGLTMFHDVESSRIKLNPLVVVVSIISCIILIIGLHIFGKGFLGVG